MILASVAPTPSNETSRPPLTGQRALFHPTDASVSFGAMVVKRRAFAAERFRCLIAARDAPGRRDETASLCRTTVTSFGGMTSSRETPYRTSCMCN